MGGLRLEACYPFPASRLRGDGRLQALFPCRSWIRMSIIYILSYVDASDHKDGQGPPLLLYGGLDWEGLDWEGLVQRAGEAGVKEALLIILWRMGAF